MKRVFGMVEVVFDIVYLITALVIGIVLLLFRSHTEIYLVPATMAIVLAAGDACHLIPRIRTIMTKDEERFRNSLGRGKQITSITMALFYMLLWRLSEVMYMLSPTSIWSMSIYGLVVIRIILCLIPQNQWTDRYPPVKWGIIRNIPFFMIGLITAVRFFVYRHLSASFSWMWLAIVMSFAFYFPVVLWANKKPKIGMLMLPKTCMYIWILAMLLTI